MNKIPAAPPSTIGYMAISLIWPIFPGPTSGLISDMHCICLSMKEGNVSRRSFMGSYTPFVSHLPFSGSATLRGLSWTTILGSLSALLLQYLAVSCPNHASHISEISLYLLSFPPSWSHQLSSLIGLQQQHRFELQELKTIRLKIQINGRSKSQNMLIKYNTWVLEHPSTEFQLPVSLNIHGKWLTNGVDLNQLKTVWICIR